MCDRQFQLAASIGKRSWRASPPKNAWEYSMVGQQGVTFNKQRRRRAAILNPKWSFGMHPVPRRAVLPNSIVRTKERTAILSRSAAPIHDISGIGRPSIVAHRSVPPTCISDEGRRVVCRAPVNATLSCAYDKAGAAIAPASVGPAH